MFKIEIDTGFAAFDGERRIPELRNILEYISFSLADGSHLIKDGPGNIIGRWILDDTSPYADETAPAPAPEPAPEPEPEASVSELVDALAAVTRDETLSDFARGAAIERAHHALAVRVLEVADIPFTEHPHLPYVQIELPGWASVRSESVVTPTGRLHPSLAVTVLAARVLGEPMPDYSDADGDVFEDEDGWAFECSVPDCGATARASADRFADAEDPADMAHGAVITSARHHYLRRHPEVVNG